ncbi:MAG: hypothetical protein IPL65_20240 [Lewinellaceae bacterium]|nr:hypothetical protein [Lewinellaceae bacterium]
MHRFSLKTLLILLPIAGITLYCAPGKRSGHTVVPTTDWRGLVLPATPQSTTGNPDAGLNYLLYGDMLGTGMPYALLAKNLVKPNADLVREGINANVPTGYTVFNAANGVPVMNGNCFSCHAAYLNGELVLGLGNTWPGYQKSIKVAAWGMRKLVNNKYKKGSPEREAFGNFGDYYRGIAPYVKTKNPGTTPAFRLEEACVRLRNPTDLRFQPKANFSMQRYTLPSDVPPLWNLDLKNALYYNSMGRGDFSKLLLQAVVLATPDSTSARHALRQMDDVLAWAKSLQPPPYPYPIDSALASEGHLVFLENCEGCHGKYAPDPVAYPNELIALWVVQTDPLYAMYLADQSGLPGWYNESWFAKSTPTSSLWPNYGYVAPPLEGIWATAPYLHNGSVPTIDDLLNSTQRPVYWERPTDSHAYDAVKLGWQYASKKTGKGKNTYNTRKAGYSNQGHTFGDELSASERKAVLEYLKTL